jgi:MFS family permease
VAFGLPALGPELRHAFGLSLPELGAVLTANFLGSGLALVAAGIAVDRFGSRRTMLLGSCLGSLGLGSAGVAGTTPALFAGLLVSGIGSAIVPVAGAGALFRVYPAARRGWALSVRQMAVPLGGTIGAALLPGLETLGGVRLPLFVGAAAVAISGTAFAVVSDSEPIRRQATKRAFRTIVRTHGMLRLLLVASIYIVVLQGVLVYSVPAVRAAGLSAFSASVTFFAINAAAIASRLTWGRIADAAGGTRRSRTLAEIGLVASLGAGLFASALHAGAVAVVAAASLFAFGAMGWNAVIYVSAGERAGSELASRSMALALTVVFLVSALSTPPLGALADHLGWDVFWLASSALALSGAVVARTLPHG